MLKNALKRAFEGLTENIIFLERYVNLEEIDIYYSEKDKLTVEELGEKVEGNAAVDIINKEIIVNNDFQYWFLKTK